MDKNDFGWDFVLISNPSSTYEKIEKIIACSLQEETRTNPLRVRVFILCLASYWLQTAQSPFFPFILSPLSGS